MPATRARIVINTGWDFAVVARSFERSLLALNRSPATINICMISVQQFGRFLEARGMPTTVANITREHVEEFIADVLSRSVASSAETRYRGAIDKVQLPIDLARRSRLALDGGKPPGKQPVEDPGPTPAPEAGGARLPGAIPLR